MNCAGAIIMALYNKCTYANMVNRINISIPLDALSQRKMSSSSGGGGSRKNHSYTHTNCSLIERHGDFVWLLGIKLYLLRHTVELLMVLCLGSMNDGHTYFVMIVKPHIVGFFFISLSLNRETDEWTYHWVRSGGERGNSSCGSQLVEWGTSNEMWSPNNDTTTSSSSGGNSADDENHQLIGNEPFANQICNDDFQFTACKINYPRNLLRVRFFSPSFNFNFNFSLNGKWILFCSDFNGICIEKNQLTF